MKSVSILALAIFAVLMAPAQAVEREYIILSGGPSLIEWEKYKEQPHDRWWGNFIRTARVRIEDLQKQHGPDARITWLCYAEGYRKRSKQDQADLLGNIYSVRDKYKVNLIMFDRGQEVTDYLNFGQPRDQVKIANLEYYGHSNKACLMFDYSAEIDSASKVFLHENDLGKLKKGIFTKDAFVKSWGCHTGESMSAKFRKATGIRMWGAIGKTDYSNGTHAVLSKPGDRWVY